MPNRDFIFSGSHLPRLTRSQERVFAYLIENPDEAAYLSSAELAERLGLSNATVVRFSQHIGFKGYLDLQRHIREEIKARLNVPGRLKKRSPHIKGVKDFLKSVILSDRENLTQMMDTVSEQDFESMVHAIHERNEVWVLGLRSCHGPAHYFATNLRFLSRRVNLISLDAGTVWSQIQPGLNPEALLITMSFPRYCQQTIDITEQFHRAGAQIVSITDSPASPLSAMGAPTVTLPYWIDSFFESSVAVISLLNAVLAGVSYLDGEETMSGLQVLEEIWEEKNVYNRQKPTHLPSWANEF